MGLFGPVLGSWSGEGSRKGGEVVSVVGGILDLITSTNTYKFYPSKLKSRNCRLCGLNAIPSLNQAQPWTMANIPPPLPTPTPHHGQYTRVHHRRNHVECSCSKALQLCSIASWLLTLTKYQAILFIMEFVLLRPSQYYLLQMTPTTLTEQ